ncbi:hypothetical protein ACJMK2_027977 [Sinanodonta woodiana]|uniref:DDE Tnp4 domain-containing protein n=1 Tax=Sinanodonta woodiana TaxID=1069815 RepID=A0ABD3X766_SINWO
MCNNNHIIADGAYPLRRWLLTPYRDNGDVTPDQRYFNHLLSANRVVIERAFGLLNGRFRRLQNLETVLVETAVSIIMTCCVLHNVCLMHHDEVVDFLQVDENLADNQRPIHVVDIQENDAEGVLKRNIITRNLALTRR